MPVVFRRDRDADSVLDYTIDWALWLAGDVIVSSVWIAPQGLTVTRESFTGSSATAWVAAGANGAQYALVNRITTAAGRTQDQTIYLRCAQR